MYWKHIKTIFSFFIRRHYFSALLFILFIVLACTDAVIIYNCSLAFLNIVLHGELQISLYFLASLTFFRVLTQFIINFIKQGSFLQLLRETIKKFFFFLPQSKDILGKSQALSKILKFESDTNFIVFDSNEYCFGFLNLTSRLYVFIIFITVLNITNFSFNFIALSLSSFCLSILLGFLHSMETQYEKNSQEVTAKQMSECNETIFSNIESGEIKNFNENFRAYVSNSIDNLFTNIRNLLIKRSLARIPGLLVLFGYYSFLLYISYLSLLSGQDKLLIICGAAYNVIFFRILSTAMNNLENKSMVNLVAQVNLMCISSSRGQIPSGNQKSIFSIDTIEFKNACLFFKDHTLNDLSFLLKKKTSSAFVAFDNTQLSIFTKILSNDCFIKSGEVLIEGHSLKSIDRDLLEYGIEIISPESVIFDETIHKNLIHESNSITDEMLQHASKIAGVQERIAALALGYYTVIDDTFDTMFRFQISLVKGLLSTAGVLIVDFSNIDEENDVIKKIKHLLVSNLTEKILMFLTKNSAALEFMTDVYLLQNNTIAAHGTHKELLYNNQEYSKFYLSNFHGKLTDE